MFRIHLFGRFRVEYDDEPVEGLGTFKVQELLSYLLVHRNRPRPRETLFRKLKPWLNQSAGKLN